MKACHDMLRELASVAFLVASALLSCSYMRAFSCRRWLRRALQHAHPTTNRMRRVACISAVVWAGIAAIVEQMVRQRVGSSRICQLKPIAAPVRKETGR